MSERASGGLTQCRQLRPSSGREHIYRVHTHTYIYTGLHTCIFTHTYLPTYQYLPSYIRTYIPPCTHACISTYLHTYPPTCTYPHTHTFIHLFIHTYLPIPSIKVLFIIKVDRLKWKMATRRAMQTLDYFPFHDVMLRRTNY